MKKLILIAVAGIIFSSCAKDIKAPVEERQPTTVTALQNRDELDGTGGYKPVRGVATVVDSKEQGFGFYLKFNDFEWEVPSNLPKQYMVQGMRVDVAYTFTDKPVQCECQETKYYIDIIDISEAPREQPQ